MSFIVEQKWTWPLFGMLLDSPRCTVQWSVLLRPTVTQLSQSARAEKMSRVNCMLSRKLAISYPWLTFMWKILENQKLEFVLAYFRMVLIYWWYLARRKWKQKTTEAEFWLVHFTRNKILKNVLKLSYWSTQLFSASVSASPSTINKFPTSHMVETHFLLENMWMQWRIQDFPRRGRQSSAEVCRDTILLNFP